MPVRPLLLSALALVALPARAAGGHFDIDDATVLDPGHCQVETWLSRAPRPDVDAAHVGAGCRVTAVELGLNADRSRSPDGVQRSLGPQVKWVSDPVSQRLSVGIVAGLAWDRRRGGPASATLYLPLTGWIASSLQLHLNAGWDHDRDAGLLRRSGAALEWAVDDALSVVGEAGRIAGDRVSRIGARWNLSSRLSLDLSLSRHRTGDGGGHRAGTLGLNREFGA